MGLPEILIEFKEKAISAITRSSNGIVAVILKDNTSTFDTKVYTAEADITKSHWTTTNLDYLSKIFAGSPARVIVERISATAENYDDALARLKNKRWNYLTIPGIDDADVSTISSWIIAQRANKKTYKAVLPNSASNDEGIINFATDNIKVGTKTYTTAAYCGRIAGLLAGLSMTESATYQVLAEVESITESTTPDSDIDAGKLILINDGEKIKIARGVNSLATLSGSKTSDMKKIKIIDGMDLIRDDISSTFEENYIGINNSYDNKCLFVTAINQYFKLITNQGVLYDQAENSASIDVDAQKAYLIEQGTDVTDMSDEDIKKAETGSKIFVTANIQLQDSMEDLTFQIYV